MWSLFAAAAMVLVLAAAAVGAALAWHVRRARPHATEPASYGPSSVDPRGRWRISRIDHAAIEPASYRLETNPDGAESLRPSTNPGRHQR